MHQCPDVLLQLMTYCHQKG